MHPERLPVQSQENGENIDTSSEPNQEPWRGQCSPLHCTTDQTVVMLLNCIYVIVFQHKDAYQVILDGVKGGPKEKRLAAQFIPKFFSSFPELADAAINAQLDLCEDEDVSVSSSRVSGSQFTNREMSYCCDWRTSKPGRRNLSFADSPAGHQRASTLCSRREFTQSSRHPHTTTADRYL